MVRKPVQGRAGGSQYGGSFIASDGSEAGELEADEGQVYALFEKPTCQPRYSLRINK